MLWKELKKKKNTKSKKIEIIFKENYFFPCIFKFYSFQNNPAYSTPQIDWLISMSTHFL